MLETKHGAEMLSLPSVGAGRPAGSALRLGRLQVQGAVGDKNQRQLDARLSSPLRGLNGRW